MVHTREVALASTAIKYLYYDTSVIKDDEWPTPFNKKVQHSGDLGSRMEHAFNEVLDHEEKAVIIGSDCPEITSEIIEEAFYKLDLADVVMGPTYDGGYYLLGMKAKHSALFQDIAWSSDKVFDQTKQKIIEQGLLFTLLQKLSDLDYKEDLDKFPAFQ